MWHYELLDCSKGNTNALIIMIVRVITIYYQCITSLFAVYFGAFFLSLRLLVWVLRSHVGLFAKWLISFVTTHSTIKKISWSILLDYLLLLLDQWFISRIICFLIENAHIIHNIEQILLLLWSWLVPLISFSQCSRCRLSECWITH